MDISAIPSDWKDGRDVFIREIESGRTVYEFYGAYRIVKEGSDRRMPASGWYHAYPLMRHGYLGKPTHFFMPKE